MAAVDAVILAINVMAARRLLSDGKWRVVVGPHMKQWGSVEATACCCRVVSRSREWRVVHTVTR